MASYVILIFFSFLFFFSFPYPFPYFHYIQQFRSVPALVNGMQPSRALRKKEVVDGMKELSKLQSSPSGAGVMVTIPCGNSADMEISTLLSFFFSSSVNLGAARPRVKCHCKPRLKAWRQGKSPAECGNSDQYR